MLYEDTTGTLLCGDLFAHGGNGPALVESDIVGAAMSFEDQSQATCLTPKTAPTIRKLAGLAPRTLALMHGSSFQGDATEQLELLAHAYERLAERHP